MIIKWFFPLLVALADHPPLEDEFEEFEEVFEEEVHEEADAFLIDELIPFQIGRERLLTYLHATPSAFPVEKKQPEIETLFEHYVKEDSTVISYGAGDCSCILKLSSLVGDEGTVIVFEPDLENLAVLFWNLSLRGVENVQLFHDMSKKLDTLFLKNVSFMRLDVGGRELFVLGGASNLLAENTPVLLLNTLAGIPVELADRYTKQEFQELTAKLDNLSYRSKRINGAEYLFTHSGMQE